MVALLLLAPGFTQAIDRQNNAKLLGAFREVVAAPANSTVQIYCDKVSASLGTIVDPAGYIVTKASELEGKIECQLNAPGKRYEATIVGRDPALDLAVLKIDAKDLPAIVWSEGDAPAVGSWLITPGLSQVPVAIGVLSVSPRRIAAPPGALGIDLDNPDEPARVKAVRPNSAAKKAGLEAGDVILKVNGKAVANNQELVMTVRGYQPGESIELLIKRGDQELTKTAVLGSLAKLFHEEGEDRAEFQNQLGGQLSERRYGFPSVIQHDSVLKPSECGGPIVDLDGKAVGINIARAGRVESFALPSSVVREAVKKMLETHQTSAGVER